MTRVIAEKYGQPRALPVPFFARIPPVSARLLVAGMARRTVLVLAILAAGRPGPAGITPGELE